MKKLSRLYKGQQLTAERYNEIINLLSGIENVELENDLNGTKHLLGSSFEYDEVVVNKDVKGVITDLSLIIKEVSFNATFTSVDGGKTFTNPIVKEADLSSDYSVLKKYVFDTNGVVIGGGTTISPAEYVMYDDGRIVFVTNYPDNEIMVNGLTYIIRQTYYILRDYDTKEIQKISMTPIPPYDVEGIFMPKEVLLVPYMLSDDDSGYVVTDMIRQMYNGIPRRAIPFMRNVKTYTFTNNAMMYWVGNLTTNPYLQIELPTRSKLNRFELIAGEANETTNRYYPTKFKVMGSIDNASWETIGEFEVATYSTKKTHALTVDTPRMFKYYRLWVTEATGGTGDFTVIEWRLFGYQENGKNPYSISATEQPISTGTSAQYFNISTNGVSGASSAFNRDNNSGSENFNFVTTATPAGKWLKVDYFVKPETVSGYKIKPTSTIARAPRTFKLEGSNDDVQWEVLDRRVNIVDWEADVVKRFNISSPKPFRYYRLYIEESNTATYCSIAEFMLMKYE